MAKYSYKTQGTCSSQINIEVENGVIIDVEFFGGCNGNLQGISRLVKEKCDFLVKIPMFGDINSLNASVAAAVLMYEVSRQRITG